MAALDHWAMTPRETFAAIAADSARRKAEHEQGMMLAWATAALSRANKLPSLQEWLHPQPQRRRSKAEHEAEFAELKAQMGGTRGG